MDSRLDLDIFHGPMDLLLHLIKRQELDVLDIPIAEVCDQFCAHVTRLRELQRAAGLDLDAIADFLVTAATLTEIKSRMLLPRPEGEDGPNVTAVGTVSESDPRYELVQQLLEYKRLKDAAATLADRADRQALKFPRNPATRKATSDDDGPPDLDLDDVQVFDLLAAFERLMGEVGRSTGRFHEVQYDDTPIALHARDIADRLTRDGPLTLRQLFEGRTRRSELIGLFLATLELVREKRVIVTLEGDDHADPAALRIEPASAEHQATYEGERLDRSEG